MPGIEELSIAVNATEEWIDDLLRRLGWTDRERVYLILLASLHGLRDAVARDEAVYIGRNCRRCCAAFTMKAGIPAHAQPLAAALRSWNASTTGCTATRASMQKRSPGPYLPCSRRACLRRKSRTPKPPRQSSYTTYGPAEAMLRS